MIKRAFLTSEWRDVISLTWPVDETLLLEHLPAGCEIDRLEGSPRVSLVAFGFLRTRVLGVPIPFNTHFPEINLRFYVRHRGERAVVFISELVPRRAVAHVARLVFNEPYRRVPMRRCGLEHDFGRTNHLRIWPEQEGFFPAEDSAEYWLTHHELGIGRSHRGQTERYRVEHPLWRLHQIERFEAKVDFASLYGAKWAFLEGQEPEHLLLAEGSLVKVFLPERSGR